MRPPFLVDPCGDNRKTIGTIRKLFDRRTQKPRRHLLTPKQTVTNDSYPAVKPPADSRSLRAET
jgi:hypothetical protein